MGQVETKVFENAPPWDGEAVTSRTDLDKRTVDACWKIWCQSSLVRRGKIREEDEFLQLMNLKEGEDREEEREQARKLFELLDRDDDQKLEFPDTMLFLFSMEDELSPKQKLRRSFQLMDRNESGRISKIEMVEALTHMGQLKLEEEEEEEASSAEVPPEVVATGKDAAKQAGKVVHVSYAFESKTRKLFQKLRMKDKTTSAVAAKKIPADVENLFSLMDFSHDAKIDETEFMRATMHYRSLAKMLTVDLLEDQRKFLKQIVQKEMEGK